MHISNAIIFVFNSMRKVHARTVAMALFGTRSRSSKIFIIRTKYTSTLALEPCKILGMPITSKNIWVYLYQCNCWTNAINKRNERYNFMTRA